MAGDDHDDGVYHPKDTIKATLQGIYLVGGCGMIVAGVQSTLTKKNIGPLGFLRVYGATPFFFAAAGGAYEFTKMSSANLREKDDYLNSAIGGMFAGAVTGMRFQRLPMVLGTGAAFSLILGAFDYTGGKLSGPGKDPNVDYFEQKEKIRLARRRPVEDTVAILGEGRGIKMPGYAERRADRIKEKYGIDVPRD